MRKSIFIVLLVSAAYCSGQSLKKDPKPLTLFTIKQNPLYTDEFIYLYKKNHSKKEDFNEKVIAEYLDLFINFKLKVTEAKAQGLDTTASFRKEFKGYRDDLKKPYTVEKDELDRLTKEAYQRLKEEIKASHILIALKPEPTPADTLAAFKKIIGIREKIMGGEDFEKTARQVSEDPTAKANGGNLGYFTALQMVYPFEQAVYRMKVGEVSQPVRTRFGYHLIKITSRQPARGEVEVSHIILRTGQGDDVKVKNKILEIYDQLHGGRNWDELCKEYSDDPATKDSGGKLRPFGVGTLAAIPEFEQVAFALKEPGEISDPFQSTYGWHILRLEKKLPLPPFSEVEPALKRKVSRDERLQIADQRLLAEKKIKLGYAEDIEIKKLVFASADSGLIKGKWKFNGDPLLKSKTLFTVQAKPHSAEEFISFVEKNHGAVGLSPGAYMGRLYDRFLEEQFDEIEEAKLIAENPDYRNLLNEYKEGILLFTIMENEVWTKAPKDSVGLKNFYAGHLEKYGAGERVRARVFATGDKNFLERIKKKIAAGDSLTREDIQKFKSIQPVRNYERGENKAIDRVPWAIGLHYAEVEETYYLVEIMNLLPPGTKGYTEAQAQIVSDYQTAMETRWIAELKQKYPVKVNNKGKKFVVTELTR